MSMDIEEAKVLEETLQRIKTSLNQRFEKNADLYVPIEDIERIRLAVNQGDFGLIKGLQQTKYPAEILVKLVIKNAWLIQNGSKLKSNFKVVQEVMAACNPDFLDALMQEEVFSNKCDISKIIKRLLIGSYLSIVDKNKCRSFLESNIDFLRNPYLRAVCITRVYEEGSAEDKYQVIENYMRHYPELSDEIKVLRQLFEEEKENVSFARFIFNKQFGPDETKTYNFWRNVFTADFYATVLNHAISYLSRKRSDSDIENCKNVLNRVQPLIVYGDPCLLPFLGCIEAFLRYNTGDNDKKQKIVSNIYHNIKLKNPSLASDMEGIMRNFGIDATVGDLPDIDGILEILNKRFCSEGKIKFLTIAFDKQYYADVDYKIDYLYDNTFDSERVVNLLKNLMKMRQSKFKYLQCFITRFARIDRNYAQYAINYINENNILRKRIKYPERDVIHDFVKNWDFELYRQLTE